ncbi:hypothetical protein DFJ58DRAFT_719089 [Suillus subalutaceus]|uniref:uncharacterized protein n=1 Tax=Suillus subalutaceus TaxID=48586 RepID=UPI001B870EDD|nr:uncharacterized protein DFJ58DRAFT_719089 [Suillus subalutaceus]KAG1836467.1 hypothetical protein DFJ58DRAFT_719089 [Suillus subalutaceus]
MHSHQPITHKPLYNQQASAVSKYTVPGKNVKMTSAKLRAQCVSHPKHTVLVTCYLQFYGHAFANVSSYGNKELVVDEQVYQCYIATQLLQSLKFDALFSCVDIVSLVSSHPAACNALVKYAAANIKDVDLGFICEHAGGILASSPISYLKAAQLRGTLFEDDYDTSTISSVFTKFYVDHTEPLAVLSHCKEKDQWCLGELLDGYEFLAIFPIAPVSPTTPISLVEPKTPTVS